eukprot:CAMPEP_0183357192 /NCGR_PEP_ID=MMETSP0164_2-20130417/45571_1 /TAXON_ID=221442 /ORGANISM="Coccolithus pelagicus ssp braarudi, Strain PLY182g" /LENGTH=174 /DNA_ID=CAMNT_0025530761 /DNA_START=143 /DNA_END=665 /DNA_ORIENTATION=+
MPKFASATTVVWPSTVLLLAGVFNSESTQRFVHANNPSATAVDAPKTSNTVCSPFSIAASAQQNATTPDRQKALWHQRPSRAVAVAPALKRMYAHCAWEDSLNTGGAMRGAIFVLEQEQVDAAASHDPQHHISLCTQPEPHKKIAQHVLRVWKNEHFLTQRAPLRLGGVGGWVG